MEVFTMAKFGCDPRQHLIERGKGLQNLDFFWRWYWWQSPCGPLEAFLSVDQTVAVSGLDG